MAKFKVGDYVNYKGNIRQIIGIITEDANAVAFKKQYGGYIYRKKYKIKTITGPYYEYASITAYDKLAKKLTKKQIENLILKII